MTRLADLIRKAGLVGSEIPWANERFLKSGKSCYARFIDDENRDDKLIHRCTMTRGHWSPHSCSHTFTIAA